MTKIELALDADGKFLAIRTDTLANMGAYLSTFAPSIPTYLHGTLMAGPYATPLIYVNVRAVFTNTVPVDAYRGAGRPEATFQLERVIDKAAREMGIDPVEMRRTQLRQARPVPLPDAGRGDLRHRQLPRDAGQAAGDRRPRRLRGAAGRERGARQAARLGAVDLDRGLRHRAVEPGRRSSAPAPGSTRARRCG